MTMPLHFLAKTSINVTLGDDHLILRGGGGGTFGRDRLFIFITDSAGKFISG